MSLTCIHNIYIYIYIDIHILLFDGVLFEGCIIDACDDIVYHLRGVVLICVLIWCIV